jgi:hypothetical protein
MNTEKNNLNISSGTYLDVLTQTNSNDPDGKPNDPDEQSIKEAYDIAESTERVVDPAGSFYAEFSDGYTFRNLIEYIRLTNFDGVIRCYKNKIKYEQSNDDETILNKFEIFTYQLTDYQISSRTNEVIIPINMVKFRNVTKNVGKKDRCSIYKASNETTLFVQIFNANSQTNGEASGLFPIETQDIPYNEYDDIKYDREKDQPNCTVYQAEFSKMCASMISVKSSYVTAHGTEKGIIFKGIKSDGTNAYIKDFGKVRPDQDKKMHFRLRAIDKSLANFGPIENMTIKTSNIPAPKLRIGEFGEIQRFSISMTTMKGLAKLNNLSPMGTLKFYVEPGKPLRIICSIGGYGELTVYIRSYD